MEAAKRRRVPSANPTPESFDVQAAIGRLLAALRSDDPAAIEDEPAFVAAGHLGRHDGDESRPCCGKARALSVLAIEELEHPALKELHAAAVKAKPLFDEIERLISGPVGGFVAEAAKRRPSPAVEQALAKLRADARAGVFESAPDAQPFELPPMGSLAEVASSFGLSVARAMWWRTWLETLLQREFVNPEAHEPTDRTGRPRQDLLRAAIEPLRETGHSYAEIARLVFGDDKQSERVREYCRPPRGGN